MIEECLFVGVAAGIAVAALLVGHVGDWLARDPRKKVERSIGAYESGFVGNDGYRAKRFEFVRYVPLFVGLELAVTWLIWWIMCGG